MKRHILFILLFINTTIATAQSFTATFTGGAAALSTSTTTQKCYPLTVSGIGTIDGTLGLASVCLNITHPQLDELEIVLRSPDGTIVPLSFGNGGSGNNYTNTCFSSTAAISIKDGSAPFTGTYLPDGYLGEVNNGQNANGIWNVCVLDRRNTGNTGTLTSFSLSFSNTPAAASPTKPACANTIPPTSTCAGATPVCDFNGLCGSTSGSSVQDWTGSNLNNCFGLQNNTFLKFVASASTVTFSVWVNSSSIPYPLGGIQMLFFSGTCNSGAVNTLACYSHIQNNSTASKPTLTRIAASGLTVGNTYYLMIDGFNNDNCSYTIAANSGVNILKINPSAASICSGGNLNLTASGGNGSYNWTPNTNLNTTTGATVNASPINTTTYTVTSTTASGCPLTDTVKVTVNAPPLISTHPSTTTQNVCQNYPTTAFTVASSAGSGTISSYQWYSNTSASYTGGTLIPSSNSSTYTPLSTSIGTTYYFVIVTNSSNCSDTSTISGAVNIIGPPNPPILNTTPPNCTTSTGTINITSSITGLVFSDDGVNYTNTSGEFTNISAGASYSITAKNTSGCISSAATGTMGIAPGAPSSPTLSVSKTPTCNDPTGTVEVTSSTTGLTFSSNGTTYTNTDGIFPNIAAGAAYSVTAKNASGCVSTAATGTMPNAPTAPNQPTLNVTPPTCTVNTGTVTVTSTLTNLTFSSNGTTYTNTDGIFPNIAAGAAYSITAKNASGCVSTAATGTMGNAPTAPTQPTLNVTPPTCTVSTGTVTVTSTLTNLTFSSNGTTYTNTDGIFPNIAAGAAYSITARNAAGCTSIAATGTMPNAPTAPTQPTLNVLPPTCTVNTGTVSVTSTLTNLTFSSNGTTYTNTDGIFPNIAAGAAYSITARNAAGCTSTAATGTMPNAPTAPIQPTLNVLPPTCTVNTGTVSVTSTLTNLTFSSNGTTYTNTDGIFPNIAAGAAYSITARNAAGCTSIAATGTMPNAPTAPTQPTLNVLPPTCTVNTGTVSVTSTLTNLTFSSNGTTYTNTDGIFPNIAAGAAYSITARNAAGCTSTAATGTMPNAPTAPTQPTLNVLPPTCTVNTGTVSVTSTLTNLTFSSNGTTYTNTDGIFPNIAAGATYSITARNAAGCTSTAATGTMPNAPTAPTQPTLNVTPPTCTVSTGTVTVTSTLTNLTFSSNGTTYTNTNGIFPNIAAGATYSITARNTAGCTSTAATGTMGSAPSTPTRPTVNPTNPTCTVATGTLTVTSSIIGLTFSKDGVDYSNASGIFSNIAAGAAYSITAKNASGCVSSAATGTMGNAPTKPNSPSFRITAPTCSVNTGTITITSSLTNLMFSSDGTNFNNTNGVFTNIPAGVSFSLTAKNSAGCISNPATGTMPNAPTIPNQPILNIDPPTCTIKTGTITVTNSLPNITFSSNGTNFNNTNGIFANIVGGAAYSITAKNAAGCISTAATGIMPLAPIVPTAPILAVTNTCGSSSINASNVTGTLSWSDGGSGNPRVFNTPAANISATQTLNGCISNTSNRVSAAPIAAIPTPTTVSGTNCKAGVVRLSANGSGTIKWYSDQSLSTLVNTGKTYAPNISLTTTYFVTNTVGSCVSLPVSVSGIITNTSNTSSITYDNVCPNRIPYTWNGKTFNSAGTYNVTLTGANGCDSIATLVLQVFTTCTDIYFPNAFSPNGDGTNDKFGPIGNLNNITNYTLSIFNRWGELVFKSNNPFEKWNGTINGQPNDTNNFIWHANYMYNGISKKVKGNIMIVK